MLDLDCLGVVTESTVGPEPVLKEEVSKFMAARIMQALDIEDEDEFTKDFDWYQLEQSSEWKNRAKAKKNKFHGISEAQASQWIYAATNEYMARLKEHFEAKTKAALQAGTKTPPGGTTAAAAAAAGMGSGSGAGKKPLKVRSVRDMIEKGKALLASNEENPLTEDEKKRVRKQLDTQHSAWRERATDFFNVMVCSFYLFVCSWFLFASS